MGEDMCLELSVSDNKFKLNHMQFGCACTVCKEVCFAYTIYGAKIDRIQPDTFHLYSHQT
jgi:hypothetical protein